MKTECTPRLALLNPRVLIGFALYAAGLVLALASMSSAVAGDDVAAELSSSIPAQATGGMWTATGDLGTPRWRHTATLLPNDQVLVAGGGGNSSDLARAEVYHPAMGRWRRMAEMNNSHVDDTATLLLNVEGDWQHDHCTLRRHGDVVAQWAGAGGRRRRRAFQHLHSKR